MNILILSCGTRNELVQFFKNTTEEYGGIVITADCSEYAPALYEGNRYYIVPRMTEDNYLSKVLDICKKESINIILPLHEDDLALLSVNRDFFESNNIKVLVSCIETIELCRDKYRLFRFFKKNNIPTITTADSLDEFRKLKEQGLMSCPVFVKPKKGCGSVGAVRVDSYGLLEQLFLANNELIVQNYVDGEEYGVDAYIDTESQQLVSVFIKKKIRMRAGETEKAISMKDDVIMDLVKQIVQIIPFMGPIDIDIFKLNGKYYVSEINPRFGGGYPHAYGCGVNFMKYIHSNARGMINECSIGQYKSGISMMKYTNSMIKQV